MEEKQPERIDIGEVAQEHPEIIQDAVDQELLAKVKEAENAAAALETIGLDLPDGVTPEMLEEILRQEALQNQQHRSQAYYTRSQSTADERKKKRKAQRDARKKTRGKYRGR